MMVDPPLGHEELSLLRADEWTTAGLSETDARSQFCL